MKQKIDASWEQFWQLPENECEHEYEDAEIFNETSHSGSFICLRCNKKLSFDVSDLGD